MIVKVYIFWKEIVQGIQICTQNCIGRKTNLQNLLEWEKDYILSNSMFFFKKYSVVDLQQI